MPGRCPKCGGRLMKRTGVSKSTGKQYVYYACEHVSARDEAEKCDFMTWDVPTDQDCPACGQTMFKRSGKGRMKPFCINEACENFLPEDKRGYYRKKTAPGENGAEAEPETEQLTAKKTAAKKQAAGKTARSASAKSGAAKKPAAKKPAARRSAKKENKE